MKKIIALMISLLLLVNTVFATGVFAEVTLSVDEANSKLTYNVGDEINIKGTCSADSDVVLRMYNDGSLMLVQTILASQRTDNTYNFKSVKIPDTYTSSTVKCDVVITADGATPVKKNVTVSGGNGPKKNKGNGGGSGGGGDNSVKTEQPSVNWSDSKKKLADSTEDVDTTKGAEEKIDDISKNTSEKDKAEEETRDNIAQTVENMAAKISAKTVKASSNRININKQVILASDLNKVDETMKILENAIKRNELSLNRSLFKELVLNVKFNDTKPAYITISQEIIDLISRIDILTISSDNYKVSYRIEELIEMLGDNETVEINIFKPVKTTTAENNKDESVAKLDVSFKTDKTNTVKVSFAGINGDKNYMAVVDENGNPVGGKYNPMTDCIEAKITESGVYSVVYNEKDYEDIKNKSEEMRSAIKKLASVGVIEGTSETEFSPDDSISRAELAALVLRVMDKLDPNADGGFVDVTRTNWYFGTAGSAKNNGIMSGYEDNTFRADNVITRDQILAISARVLKNEMRYITPQNVNEYLTYTDSVSIPEWARNDIALATMADLVVRSTDNKFNSTSGMTRGDAAIVVMKLFEKLW